MMRASSAVIVFGFVLMFLLSVYAVWVWSIGGYDKYFEATDGMLLFPLALGCGVGLIAGSLGSFMFVVLNLFADEELEDKKRERCLNHESGYSSFTLGYDY